jgi:hypothetical protein
MCLRALCDVSSWLGDGCLWLDAGDEQVREGEKHAVGARHW